MINSLTRRAIPTVLVLAVTAGVALVLQVRAQTPASPAAPQTPKLVVLFVIDQFRADYVETYGHTWTGGLREIFQKGAHFTEAAYPYSYTVTCAGHNTIGTGTVPATHGMIGNEWFDASTHAFVTCTEDPAAKSIGFGGGKGTEHHSARWLRVPAFADELKRQSAGARVVSMSGKPRSAIGMGGHGGPNSIILWEEDADGTIATSSALARGTVPEVDAFVKSNPIRSIGDKAWTRAMPESAYRFADKAEGEPNDNVFPHSLKPPIRTSRTTGGFIEEWDRTPLFDAYLGKLGATLVDGLGLGQRQGTDMLAIGFSGLDTAGHAYGPRSHEIQDTLARLDKILGELVDLLDRKVGRNRYILALSADHGVATIPEQAAPTMNAGRLNSLAPVGNAVEAVLEKELGAGSYVEAISAQSLYFHPGVLERIRVNPAIVKAVETAALSARGIANVYWPADLAAKSPTDDAVLARARKSYMAGRSGDLMVIQRRNWVVASTGTSHGSPYDYDARVPVVLFGAGIKAGRYATSSSPVDIAPTLAALTRVKLAKTDGRVLTEALADQAP